MGNSCEAHEKFDPENRLLSGDSPAKFFYSEKPLFMQKWIYGRDRSNDKFELINRKTQTCRTQTSHQTIEVIYLHLQPNSNHKLEWECPVWVMSKSFSITTNSFRKKNLFFSLMLSKLLCSLAFTYAALTKNSWEIVQFEHSMLAFLSCWSAGGLTKLHWRFYSLEI